MSTAEELFKEHIDGIVAKTASPRATSDDFDRSEKKLRSLLCAIREVVGVNDRKEAQVHLALGIALHNRGMRSQFPFGWGLRKLRDEAESHFLVATLLYGNSREAFDVLIAHANFNTWTASHYSDSKKQRAIFERSYELIEHGRHLLSQPDAESKTQAQSNEDAGGRGQDRGGASTVACAADREMAAQVEQAVAAGLEDLKAKAEEDRSENEAAHDRQLQGSAARADAIIAAIPEIIRCKTAEKCSRAVIMTLDRLESDEPRGSTKMGADAFGIRPFVNEGSLRYAARLVYDHCKRVGLKPYVYRTIPEGQAECLLTLNISWDNPAESRPG